MSSSKTYNSTTTNQGSSVADLPAWAKPYFERNLAKAEAEYGKAYNPYTGDRDLQIRVKIRLMLYRVRVISLLGMV
tara:strand:- start:315 stop:542 length:228 start_codon:yes stop_codon:yes gene_type:complete